MPEKKIVSHWLKKDLNQGNLDKILQHSDIYEAKLLKKVVEEKSFIPYSHVYQLQTDKSWQLVGYHCFGCDKVIKSKNIILNHKNVCKRINTLYETNKLEIYKGDYMPIQTVTIKGEKFYRWGDQGKLYRNRADAEKQAAAAYASGYKSKDMKDSKGK